MGTTIGRASVAICALIVAALLTVMPGFADEWPSRRVTVIVPLGAGSASDLIARVVAAQLANQTKQTFVVENRPGGGGTIGATSVARAAPDDDLRIWRARL